MPRTYVANSNTNRVRQFFLANPDEELTYADINIKFGMSLAEARYAVRELRAQGLLRTEHTTTVKRKQ